MEKKDISCLYIQGVYYYSNFKLFMCFKHESEVLLWAEWVGSMNLGKKNLLKKQHGRKKACGNTEFF